MIDVEIDTKYSNEIDFDSLNAESKGKGIQFDTFLQHSLKPSDIVTTIIVTLPQGLAVNLVYDALKYIFNKLKELFKGGKYSFTLRSDENVTSLSQSGPITSKVIDQVMGDFYIKNPNYIRSYVYLEGRTDEKYFNKTIEAYNLDLPFTFRWIGYIGDNGQERNTGKDAVNNAYEFLVMNNLSIKNICLLDCDAKAINVSKNNVFKITIPSFRNSKGLNRGIENALVLDNLDLSDYYSTKTEIGPYGEKKSIQIFEKMNLCNYICGLDNETAKPILIHLKEEIDTLVDLYQQK